MMDFNIQYGLSTEIFINGQLNPDLIIEEGCWYLCTDTAELFLGAYDTDENGQRFLTLKIINEASGDFITPAELEAYGFITEQYIAGKQDTIADLDAIRAGAALGKTALQTIPEEYITETELANKGYITNVSDKADIDHKHEEYALAEHEHNQYLTEQDISGKADKSELFSKDYNELINKPVIPSIEGLATEKYVDNAIREAELSGKEVDLSAYATKVHVAEEIAKIEIPTIPDLTDYAKKSDIPGISDFIEAIPGDYITESELAAKGFITSTADKADKEHTHSYNELTDRPEIPEAYNDSELRTLVNSKAASDHTHEEYSLVDHKHSEYLTEQSLGDYATKQDVADAIANHEGLAKKEEVEEVKTKLEIEVLPIVPTVQELAEKAATQEWVTEQKYLQTETFNTAIATKADKVPFTTDKFVTNPTGLFVAGDNVNGLTIAQIFAKLLGLSDIAPGENPENPENPEEPEGIVDTVITHEIPMYSVTKDGALVETTFKLIDGNDAPVESGFYTIKDAEGNILEAGYQDLQIENDEVYYVIALPKEIDYNTMVEVETYDPDEKIWVDADIALTSDPEIVAACCDEVGIDITHIDTDKYTVWVQEDICTGSIIRYRIIEEN